MTTLTINGKTIEASGGTILDVSRANGIRIPTLCNHPALRAKMEKAWGVPLSDKTGLTVVEMMNAAHVCRLKAMYIMGENPLVTDPDLHHVEEALKRLDFLVIQDIFFTETAALAAVTKPP